MSRTRKILFAILVVSVVIQFIRPARNKSEQVLQTDIANTYNVPDKVHVLFKKVCYDCHSNSTNYPWYSNIQPMGWLIAKDIKDGKEKMNLSEFGSLSLRKQVSRLTGIENSIKDGIMPLSGYTLLHKDARLTDEDKALLLDWIEETKANIERIRAS